jgi:hypothetical protein
MFVDESLRRGDKRREIEAERRLGGDDAADFRNDRRVEKPGSDKAMRSAACH